MILPRLRHPPGFPLVPPDRAGWLSCVSWCRFERWRLPFQRELLLLFSCLAVSDSLQPHRLQHARLLCLYHLPEFAQTHVHWVSDAIQPSHPLSSPSLPTFNLSQHQGLSNEPALCIRWPKYWSFSISPTNGCAVQGASVVSNSVRPHGL